MVVGFVAALYAAVVIGIKRRRVSRRYASAASNNDRVDAAWQEAVESLRPLGLSPDPTETSQEFSRRAGIETAPARRPLARLGALSVEATYGLGDLPDTAVDEAADSRDEIIEAVNSLTTTSERLKDALDPRALAGDNAKLVARQTAVQFPKPAATATGPGREDFAE